MGLPRETASGVERLVQSFIKRVQSRSIPAALGSSKSSARVESKSKLLPFQARPGPARSETGCGLKSLLDGAGEFDEKIGRQLGEPINQSIHRSESEEEETYYRDRSSCVDSRSVGRAWSNRILLPNQGCH